MCGLIDPNAKASRAYFGTVGLICLKIHPSGRTRYFATIIPPLATKRR